jgi:hypothetical protein
MFCGCNVPVNAVNSSVDITGAVGVSTLAFGPRGHAVFWQVASLVGGQMQPGRGLNSVRCTMSPMRASTAYARGQMPAWKPRQYGHSGEGITITVLSCQMQ